MKKTKTLQRSFRKFRDSFFNLNGAVVVVAFLIAANWVWGSINAMQNNYNLQKEIDLKKQELLIAQLETQTLEFQKKYYQSREYQELAARQYLNLVTPGENVLILPDNSQEAIDYDRKVNESKSGTNEQPSNFRQWMDFLLGNNVKTLN